MQITIFWYENRSSNRHSIDSHNAGQHHYKLPQNLSDFTVPLHTAGVGGRQARRVLSAFTSAWVYMNMHDCRVLGAIHQQSVQHATTIRLTADLHSRAWLSILLRSTSAEIGLLRFKRFPREQTWLNFYIWFDRCVNIKSPCENDDASYRAFRELLINVNWKWAAIGVFTGAAVLSRGLSHPWHDTYTHQLTRGWMGCKRGSGGRCLSARQRQIMLRRENKALEMNQLGVARI